MRRRLLALAALVVVATSCTPAQRALAGLVTAHDTPEFGDEATTAFIYKTAWCGGIDDGVYAHVPADHPVWSTVEAATGPLPDCP